MLALMDVLKKPSVFLADYKQRTSLSQQLAIQYLEQAVYKPCFMLAGLKYVYDEAYSCWSITFEVYAFRGNIDDNTNQYMPQCSL
jgi:hypothetical protein